MFFFTDQERAQCSVCEGNHHDRGEPMVQQVFQLGDELIVSGSLGVTHREEINHREEHPATLYAQGRDPQQWFRISRGNYYTTTFFYPILR